MNVVDLFTFFSFVRYLVSLCRRCYWVVMWFGRVGDNDFRVNWSFEVV